LDSKFLNEGAAQMIGTSNPPHWSCAVVVRVNRDAGL
jgi:hypothetical protein